MSNKTFVSVVDSSEVDSIELVGEVVKRTKKVLIINNVAGEITFSDLNGLTITEITEEQFNEKNVLPEKEEPVVVTSSNTGRVVEGSKSQKAQEIYDREYIKGTRRCDVIRMFISEAGLTDKGAPTYFQNIRKSRGHTGNQQANQQS